MNVLRMAWRNVWRNTRRSAVTIGAMAFALCVEVLYAGLLPGYLQGLEADIVDLELGDVQVFAAGYRDRPSLYAVMKDADAALAALDAQGIAASARLLAGGLAASGGQDGRPAASAGVMLRGVDPAREARVSLLGERLAEGAWLAADDPHGVVIGRQLARNLGAHPGDELIVLSQAADGSTANDLFHVRGVLLGVSEGTDRAAVLMLAPTFRALMELPEGAHQLVLRRGDRPLDAIAAAARAAAPGRDVQTWREFVPILAQMLDGSQGIIYIVFFVVYVAVGILITNAMLMAVFERIRELGVLKALGAGPVRVLTLIYAETAMQTAIATAAGLTVAAPFMRYLARTGVHVGALGGVDAMGIAMRPVWYGIYTPAVIGGPLVMLWVIAALAALYPAVTAAMIDPVAAMKHR